MKTCPVCGNPLQRRPKEAPSQWERRTYCSWSCSSRDHNHERHAAGREALIEDLERLIGTDRPLAVAARLGYDKPRSLARRLQRAGRPDLACVFDQIGRADRSRAREAS